MEEVFIKKTKTHIEVDFGQRWNSLVFISNCDKKNGTKPQWVVRCDCGNIKSLNRSQVMSGHNKTCGDCNYGVYNPESTRYHGMNDTRIYGIWSGMLGRCNNPNKRGYPRYGGRGIKVCDRWHCFVNFYEDTKEGYEDHLVLDRIDPDGDYCLENVRWTTHKVNAFNTKPNVLNKSGVEGVWFRKDKGVWSAGFQTGRRRMFSSFSAALMYRIMEEYRLFGYCKVDFSNQMLIKNLTIDMSNLI